MPDIQASLFCAGDLSVVPDAPVVRTWLDDDSWVDHAVAFLDGQLDLFEALSSLDIWHRGQRLMFGSMVDEPRLSAGMRVTDERLPAAVGQLHATLADRYGTTSSQTWLNWYRSGDDAVAWHADRIGENQKDPSVAIVSLGSARRFLVRPKGGGSSTVFEPAGGDLLVMGGATQHRWEHCVPRSWRGGARISVTFRPRTDEAVRGVTWARGRVRLDVPDRTGSERTQVEVGIQDGRVDS